MPGKGRFGSARQATHIHIENLEVRLIVMPVALTVLPIDPVQRLFHLLHILRRTGIQGALYHRLLGTATAPKGLLQGTIGSQARSELHPTMGSCPSTDQRVVDFVSTAILDG